MIPDNITLQEAVENPVWLTVWADEPERNIYVRMTYSDLKIIRQIILEKNGVQ